MRRSKTLFVFTAMALLVVGPLVAEADNPKGGEKNPPKADKLEPYKCGKVERLHTLGGVFLASQPSQEDFKLASENGIKTVINLRPKDELQWDEETLVKKLGMEYHALPFKSAAKLTDEIFDKARQLLKDKAKKPILLHCSSANRVGAIWLAHRVLDYNLSYDEALKEAEMVGLKLPALAEKAKDYIRRKESKK